MMSLWPTVYFGNRTEILRNPRYTKQRWECGFEILQCKLSNLQTIDSMLFFHLILYHPPLTPISNKFDVAAYTSGTSQAAKEMQETLTATVMATAIVAAPVPGTAAPADTCQIYTAADEPLLIHAVRWFIYLVCVEKWFNKCKKFTA